MSSYEFGDDANTSVGGRFSQPGYVALHLIFRTAAFFTYLFCSVLIANFVTSFVVVVILLSLDFWIVKNITGRKLVGLRWWNFVNEEGESKWIYESRKAQVPSEVSAVPSSSSPQESRIFWIALIVSQVIWGILLFVAIFTLSIRWFVLVCIANFLNGANLYGYMRCRFGAKDAQNAAMKYVAPQLFRNAWSGMTSRFSKKPSSSSPLPSSSNPTGTNKPTSDGYGAFTD